MMFKNRHRCFFCRATLKNPDKNVIRYVYEDGEAQVSICDKCAGILDDEVDDDKKKPV